MRSAECGVRSAECGVRSAECGVRSAGCGVRRKKETRNRNLRNKSNNYQKKGRMKWIVQSYISFSPSGIFNSLFSYPGQFTFAKKRRKTSGSVLTMYRKCEKLHPRFCWKAMLPRINFELCPCEVTMLEPFNNMSTARLRVINKLKRP